MITRCGFSCYFSCTSITAEIQNITSGEKFQIGVLPGNAFMAREPDRINLSPLFQISVLFKTNFCYINLLFLLNHKPSKLFTYTELR
uniref:Uncharacterized protein n=1 Tax=Anguilla anguilla TaxID=7936 RepID=A0A0E9X3P5_ANGAN